MQSAMLLRAGPEHRNDVAATLPPAPRSPGARVLVIAVVGLTLGLSTTALVLERGWDPGSVKVGSWVARPRTGTPAIDPYARAAYARTGEVPLAAGEGLGFTATTDETGYRLLRTCSYRVGGTVPAARLWTLTATDEAGRVLDGPAHRFGFTSSTVTRDLDGGFSIEVGPSARTGDWLPTGGDGPLRLVLRLYDTPLATSLGDVAGAILPAIVRQSCAETGGRPGGSPGP